MAAYDPNMALYGAFGPATSFHDHGKALNQMHGYGITTPHDMKAPLGHGLTARRQLNWVGILTALFIPFGLFVLCFWVMSGEIYYRHAGMALMIVAVAILFTLVLGAFALQVRFRTEQRGGARTWHFFICLTGLIACLAGSLLGAVNMAVNAQTYYDYISLRKAVDVDPGQQQGQQLLDAGEVDFKAGTKIDRKLHSLWHKSNTYCVAPIVSADGSKLASYDFWAVGMDCCSAKSEDFSCGYVYTSWTSSQEPPKGLRVMDTAAIQGYRLAVEQAVAAHNIQSTHPIFLFMDKLPYAQIKQYWSDARFCAMVAFVLYFIIQAALVMLFSWKYGKGWPSGFMDIDKTYHALYHNHWHGGRHNP